MNPLLAVAEVGAKTTEEKYREYLMTGFVKAVTPVVIDHAEGATVTDVNGRTYLDCFAGISVVNAGHCNPEVIAAAKAQIDKLVHCCSYVYHVPAVADMAEKMAEITPGRLKKTFFANSGAEAVEGALEAGALIHGQERSDLARSELPRPHLRDTERDRQLKPQETWWAVCLRCRVCAGALHVSVAVGER